MNKHEKEELITFVNRAKEDLNFSFGICQKTYYGYVQGNKLINYIEQLNESEENIASTIKLLTNLEPDDFLKELKLYGLAKEPQKVKAPQFVADWFEENKHNLSNSLWKFTAELNEKTLVTGAIYTEFESWFIAQPRVYEFITRMGKGYEVEESKWVVNEGDLVIRKGEHEAKVSFVESVDDDGILLVNGIKDEFFTDLDDRSVGEESINYFYENFRLLAKKENLEAEKVEV